jgi:hypothetical protein
LLRLLKWSQLSGRADDPGRDTGDHVKSLAWAPRNAEYVCCCPGVAEEVIAKIESLFPM